MGCGDRNNDAGLTDLKAAEAVDNAHVRYLKIAFGLFDEVLHLFESHRFVRFVKEMLGLTKVAGVCIFGEFSCVTIQRDCSPALGRHDTSGDGRDVDCTSGEFAEISGHFESNLITVYPESNPGYFIGTEPCYNRIVPEIGQLPKCIAELSLMKFS